VKPHPLQVRGTPATSSRQGEAVLLLAQHGQKLHIGLSPLAIPRYKFASDVVLEVLVRITRLNPAQVKRMLAIYSAELM
jgi:hypothetical protein